MFSLEVTRLLTKNAAYAECAVVSVLPNASQSVSILNGIMHDYSGDCILTLAQSRSNKGSVQNYGGNHVLEFDKFFFRHDHMTNEQTRYIRNIILPVVAL